MNAPTRTVTGRISTLWRLRNTVSGNPRYGVTLINGESFTTAPDASYVYGLESKEYVGEFGGTPPLVTLTVNADHQIENISSEAES